MTTTAQRAAIWRANDRKCFYCGELVRFADLEIDHLIPQSITTSELDTLRASFGLSASFSVQDSLNLVPTHHDCNRRKYTGIFSESTARFYLELWANRQQRILDEYKIFRRQAENDQILAVLTNRVESGLISTNEVSRLLAQIPSCDETSDSRKPLVASLSININKAILPPKLKAAAHVKIANYLEEQLISSLRKRLKRPLIQTEVSARNGETLSIRIAVWDVDVDRLQVQEINDWQLLGLDFYDDVYENDVSPLFEEALHQTFDIFVAERTSCPRCDGTVVITGTAMETGELAIGTCERCGWENYFG